MGKLTSREGVNGRPARLAEKKNPLQKSAATPAVNGGRDGTWLRTTAVTGQRPEDCKQHGWLGPELVKGGQRTAEAASRGFYKTQRSSEGVEPDNGGRRPGSPGVLKAPSFPVESKNRRWPGV